MLNPKTSARQALCRREEDLPERVQPVGRAFRRGAVTIRILVGFFDRIRDSIRSSTQSRSFPSSIMFIKLFFPVRSVETNEPNEPNCRSISLGEHHSAKC